jgi:hypothetical protein
MTLDALLHVLPRPTHPVETMDERDWELYELVTGITLPEDYKAYLSVYGTGLVGGVITPYNPFCRRSLWKPSYKCRDWMRQALGIQEFKRKFGEATFPYPLYPQTGGVLPWGGTDDGDQLFWLTNGEPNMWTVLINEVRSPNFEAFDYSMTGFLRAWIDGEIQSDIIPYDAIDHDLLFEPLN